MNQYIKFTSVFIFTTCISMQCFSQMADLDDGPWLFETKTQSIRVSVVSKGLDHPWAIAFLPDGDMLVSERAGNLRIIRDGLLDPEPVKGLPQILSKGFGGLLDIVLHPQYAQNHLIYFSYSKAEKDGATIAVAKARFDGGSTVSDAEDVIVTDAWHNGFGAGGGSPGSRIAFDKQEHLYITVGDRGQVNRAQDPTTHLGKILRINEDGSVPESNPFVHAPGYKPEIFSMGHRSPLGLKVHPDTGELWSTEQGPQGGDELNIILSGKNYGWPLVSTGRNYDGTLVGDGLSLPELEDPFVYWVPSIAASGLDIYTGDAFPEWKGNAFVGAMHVSGENYSGFVQRIFFNDEGLPIGREPLIPQLRYRIRAITASPDGLLYVLTDETLGAVLKIEPAN